ncbi:MAG: TIGR00297 family protein [Archaeoglobaceae archaeon]|nr:TIGR00297 family protein [Archaeoglobaceae archaeon]MDW8118591.1 TIGR00297 family protein [Archaeoglobaceae archaeon]
MFPAAIALLIALIGISPYPVADPRLIFAIMFIFTAIYVRQKNGEYFQFLLTATLLSGLACFMQKDVVYAAIFVSFFHELRRSPIWDIPIYSFAGAIFFSIYSLLNNLILPLQYILFIAIAGGLSGALIESIKTETDKRVLVLLALATVFAIFKIYIPSASLESLAIAFTISFILSLMALKAGIADESGLMSATLIGTVTILFTNLKFFAILLFFYLLGSGITKYKYSLKDSLGIAEPAGGARGFSNVFGNSLAPLFFAMNYGVTKEEIFAFAFIASVATALGDTMASEIGKTAKNVYLITNFQKVKPGTNGGISIIGEIGALSGCFLVSLLAFSLGILPIQYLLPVIVSGFIAIHIDSLLGATLEIKGYLTNSGVNFLATLFGGFICFFFFLH